MLRHSPRFYVFGSFRLDPDEKVLLNDDHPVPLTPKALDTLLILVGRHGHLVAKDELIRSVWPDTVVEENNLTQNISALRRVLGDGVSGGRFIETVPRRGYRFVADVTEPGELAPPLSADHGEAATVDADAVTGRALPRGWRLAGLIGLLAALCLVLLAIRERRAPRATESFARMRMVGLTTSGNVTAVALSPDGLKLAMALDENGRQALWVRPVATAPGVRIVPPAEAEYWGLSFAPDGSYVYALTWEPNRADPVLMRVPVGGGPTEVLTFFTGAPDGPLAFSPDGRRVAYVHTTHVESRLIIANIDGTEPRTLALRRDPARFATWPSAPAWSPEGSTIVVGDAAPGAAGWRTHLTAVRLSDGADRAIGSTSWVRMGRIAWLPDGSGVMLAAGDERWAPRQVWHVSYPDGATRRVTNDLDEYRDLAVAPDAATLVALKAACVSSLWIAPAGRAAEAKRLMTEGGKFDGIEGMSWTPDGRLVYRSRAGGNWDLWVFDPSEEQPRRLTSGPHAELHPSVSPDGAAVVFVSDRSGRYELYRMPLQGGDALRLTDDGEDSVYPTWAGDGGSVVFQSGGMIHFRPAAIWRIPPTGGSPARIAAPNSIRPAVSPDGRQVAYYTMHEGRWVIQVVPIEGGPPIARFSIPPSSSRTLRFMPDGRALAYVVTRAGVSNVWKQPLQGGPPEPVTDFSSDRIFDFSWSRDGRQLAVMRALETSDAVRISSFR